jgi:trans-2-enoyl-CoA reductase
VNRTASGIHAQRLVVRRNGKPADVVDLESFDPGEPGDGEILLRILASPINPADLNMIEGTYGTQPPLPFVPGIEGCGIVEKSGSEDFAAGDLVMILSRAEGWSTHRTIAADQVFKLPQGIDPVQAAMLKANPGTAWLLLHAFGKPETGDWIVQNLGNSAVGRCVIQLARSLEIRSISFVRDPAQADALHALGADHVFADDRGGASAAADALGKNRAALAFNAVGGESALRLMKLLRDGGTHITYGAMARKPLTVPNGLLIFRDLRLRGLWVSRWLDAASREAVDDLYTPLAARIAAGTLMQPVDGVHPLSHWREALARLDYPERRGKILFGAGALA